MVQHKYPGVIVTETDQTATVRGASSSTGGFIGRFRWGPVNLPIRISDESQLVEVFGAPSLRTAVDFLTVSQFFVYGNDCFVTRAISNNLTNANNNNNNNILITNQKNYDQQRSILFSDGQAGSFAAKYPGSIGNSLSVEVIGSIGDYDNWEYRDLFSSAPGTSPDAELYGATNDEIHVVVIDRLGLISGTTGAVLETFEFLSQASDSKRPQGGTNYYVNIINNQSRYVWVTDHHDFMPLAGSAFLDGIIDFSFDLTSNGFVRAPLGGGNDGDPLDIGDYQTSLDILEDEKQYQVNLFFMGALPEEESDAVALTNAYVASVSNRKEAKAVVFASANETMNTTARVLSWANKCTYSDRLALTAQSLRVYDKYNDQFINIPASSTHAGAYARTDNQIGPWAAAAGSRRGVVLGASGVTLEVRESDLISLHQAKVNPITSAQGQGFLIYGDDTHVSRPTAFDQISVRRTFDFIESAIANFAESFLWENNDAFTRASFVGVVEPFLRDIQGRRGIANFSVRCDETNNTPTVISRKEFRAEIRIEPVIPVNYITLNFVADRSGANFEEIA